MRKDFVYHWICQTISVSLFWMYGIRNREPEFTYYFLIGRVYSYLGILSVHFIWTRCELLVLYGFFVTTNVVPVHRICMCACAFFASDIGIKSRLQILENTPQSHADFGSLTKAQGLISDALDSTNTAVGTKLLDRRIDWLRSHLLGGDTVALDWLITSSKRSSAERLHLLFYGTVFKVGMA